MPTDNEQDDSFDYRIGGESWAEARERLNRIREANERSAGLRRLAPYEADTC